MNTRELFQNVGNLLLSTAVGLDDPSKLMELNQRKVESEKAANQAAMQKQSEQLMTMMMLKQMGITPPGMNQDAQMMQSMGMTPPAGPMPQFDSEAAEQGFNNYRTPAPGAELSKGRALPNYAPGVTGYKLGNISFGETPRQKADLGLAVRQAEGEMDIKTQAAKESAKELAGAKKTVNPMSRLFNGYIRSAIEKESKYPGSSETSLKGRIQRLRAGVESSIAQTLPESQAFKKLVNKFGYERARAIEGGRVTDKDVEIVSNTLFNSDLPLSENLRLANDYIKDLQHKGLSKEEIRPIYDMVDLAKKLKDSEIREDKNGVIALVKDGEVLQILGED
jgi:hypothetical protein